jgi:RHS repeat-associated protein
MFDDARKSRDRKPRLFNAFEIFDHTGVVARYEQNQNIDEPLAMLRSSATCYFHADGLGSVTSLSNSAGSIANTYAYDSYGNWNSFRYTGREFDSETNLYYYRARYYDPTAGRFLSEDPLQLVFSDSQYQYAAANPITRNDPLGLWPEIWQLPRYFWKTYNWVSGTNTAAEMMSDFITGNGICG